LLSCSGKSSTERDGCQSRRADRGRCVRHCEKFSSRAADRYARNSGVTSGREGATIHSHDHPAREISAAHHAHQLHPSVCRENPARYLELSNIRPNALFARRSREEGGSIPRRESQAADVNRRANDTYELRTPDIAAHAKPAPKILRPVACCYAAVVGVARQLCAPMFIAVTISFLSSTFLNQPSLR
jgi:hypothetical protein